MKEIPNKQKLLLITIYAITIACLIHSFNNGYMTVDFSNLGGIVFFVLLTAIAESLTIVFNNMSFSLSFVINIICYVLFGPFKCLVIITLGYLLRIIKYNGDEYIHVFNTPLYGTLYNCCGLILPMILSNYIYIFCFEYLKKYNSLGYIFLITMFSCTCFVLNVLIMSLMMSVKMKKNIFICIYNNVGMSILSVIIMIPISILIIYMFKRYSYISVFIMIFVMSLVRYTLSLYSTSKEQLTETVSALMNSVEARDKYTNGHSRRVAEISTLIAKHLKLTVWDIEKLNVAAMLHDVGKIGISDNILQKPGKLTDEEFAIIKSHPEIGMSIIKDIKNIDYAHPIVRHHHERYDGKGYPDGKKGEELSLMVYIVQLADAVDAMASDRPYRRGLPQEVIIEEIKKGAGTQFHPKVSRAYLDILEEKGSKAFMKDENKLII